MRSVGFLDGGLCQVRPHSSVRMVSFLGARDLIDDQRSVCPHHANHLLAISTRAPSRVRSLEVGCAVGVAPDLIPDLTMSAFDVCCWNAGTDPHTGLGCLP